MYIVRLIGEGVFHNSVNVCVTDDVESIEVVRDYIKSKYDVVIDLNTKSVDKFMYTHYNTNRDDVNLELEPIKLIR